MFDCLVCVIYKQSVWRKMFDRLRLKSKRQILKLQYLDWTLNINLPSFREQIHNSVVDLYQSIRLTNQSPTSCLKKEVSKFCDHSRRRPEGSSFYSYLPRGREGRSSPWITQPTLTLILNCRVLSRIATSTIYQVFSMTCPGFEPKTLRAEGEHSDH